LPKKSVIFLESSENIGGQELQILQQMHELNRLGWKTELLCTSSSRIMQYALSEGLNVSSTSFRNALDIFSIYKIIRKILTNKAIVLICHSGHDAINAALASRVVGCFTRRPTVIRMRTYQPGTPSSFSYNYLFDHTYTPSSFLRNRLLENLNIKSSKVSVLYPGINFDQLSCASEELPKNLMDWLSGHPGPVICQCAMLRNEKGHAVVLQALPAVLKDHPNLRYVIAGDGPALSNLKDLVCKLNLIEHVYFAGMVQPISALLKISTLAVMPSLKEPLGMFQIES
jgi:glycosyltransferase involved in cell wall biosynthesis